MFSSYGSRLVGVLLLATGLTSCSTGSSTAKVASPPTAAAETTSPSSSAMTISGFTYDPSPITVAPGTTIPVKNLGGPEHTVTSDVKGLFLADDIGSGETVSFKAPAKAGRYTFHCEYHPYMHGVLIVS